MYLPRKLNGFSLDIFAPHAAEVGFFLNLTRFLNEAAIPEPIGSHSRPCPALLFATYLWATHFRGFIDVSQERSFESLAKHHCLSDMETSHPKRVLHTIQAYVLLAHHHLTNANLPEAKFYAVAAANLITSAGLQEANPSESLPLPLDAIEVGERLDSFWAVVSVSRTIAIYIGMKRPRCEVKMLECLGSESNVPWPLEGLSYEQVCGRFLKGFSCK